MKTPKVLGGDFATNILRSMSRLPLEESFMRTIGIGYGHQVINT